MLDVRDIAVSFAGHPVLDGVSLTVEQGEVVALQGPSGSGKSTLLRVIAGLLAPASGAIVLDGRDVTAVPTHERGIGMVFQDEQLFPHRDVAANVGFGLRMQGVDAATRRRRVDELLGVVGLAGFGARRVTDLSGGEAKRVALARSLAPSPRLLLLDEPLTGLDAELHDRLAGELAAILRRTGTTALLVTHDLAEAEAVADRVVTMAELTRPSVVAVAAEETHDLRRRVLRTGTPSTQVVFNDDELPSTRHLAVRGDDGRLVAISSWAWRPFPGGTGRDVQLRGMAVDPAVRSRGLGGVLLEAGVAEAFAAGAEQVWANARDPALAFYVRHGFDVVGDGYLDAATAVPHHRIVRRRP